MTPKAQGRVTVGNSGITPDLEAKGYVGTICSQVQDKPPMFQDLHVTRKQLEELQKDIVHFLSFVDKA